MSDRKKDDELYRRFINEPEEEKRFRDRVLKPGAVHDIHLNEDAEPEPTDLSDYYTKDEIEALLAALSVYTKQEVDDLLAALSFELFLAVWDDEYECIVMSEYSTYFSFEYPYESMIIDDTSDKISFDSDYNYLLMSI